MVSGRAVVRATLRAAPQGGRVGRGVLVIMGAAPARKRIVSVSLGSSRRDHRAEVELLGTVVSIARCGFDGDVDAAERAIAALDGQVDAIGLGGLDVYLHIAGDRYVIADGERLLKAAGRTPCVDGSALKQTLEPAAVRWLATHGPLPLAGLPVLMVSALDRYGMAVALEAAGCAVVYGDLMFTAGVPYPIESLADLRRIAGRLAREMVKLPVRMLYPTGAAQDAAPQSRFPGAFARAALIAGDYHLLRRYLPGAEVMSGKAVLTQTTTAADRAALASLGVRYLFTTTPVVGGRSFGTNVWDAALVAVLGRRPEDLGAADYAAALATMGYRPEVLDLQAPDDPVRGA